MGKKITAIFSLLLMFCIQAQAQEFESAADAVKNMGVGWNLGNTLDAWADKTFNTPADQETCWGQPVTKPELMKMMKEAGFGAIRVPVTWFPWTDADGNVKPEWMKRVHEVVDYVIDQGLYCILNVHHDTGEGDQRWLIANESVYDQTMARYENLWKHIAEEFKDYDQKLLFESYNEMLDIDKSWCFATFATKNKYDETKARNAYNAINKYAQSFVDVVRATGGNNVSRNLIVNTYAACCGSGTWNAHLKDPLKEMLMPTDPVNNTKAHIAFQVHAYPNVENINSTKSELDDMFEALNTHLIAKGGPVIIGEWGTSNVDAGAGKTDYDVRRDNVFQFVDYFIQKTKEMGIATFLWMGLSDGHYRSMPAFNQADLAERITKAYYGDSFQGIYPTPATTEVDYVVEYTSDWQELNLYSGSAISLSEYKGMRVEMEDDSYVGKVNIKIYGGKGGKDSTQELTGASTTITFNSSVTGSNTERITLQTKIGAQTAVLRDAYLIKRDGTEVKTDISVFWGCNLTTQPRATVVLSPKAPTESNAIFNLSGQRISSPQKGIYIQNGKKYVIR